MTIYQLFIFSCVTTFALNGDYTKSCSWSMRDLFVVQEACAAEGAGQIGKPILSFIVEDRKIEDWRCSEVHVRP
jgi:hypothetical protein